MDRVIRQKFQVQFNYNISFTQGIFDLNNPLLSHVLDSGNPNKKAKAVVVLDKGMFACHPRLIRDIKAYFQS